MQTRNPAIHRVVSKVETDRRARSPTEQPFVSCPRRVSHPVQVSSLEPGPQKVHGNKPPAVHSNSHPRNRRRYSWHEVEGRLQSRLLGVICLVLYLVALLAHFGVVKVSGNVADWAWIIGFGLLLAAVQIRGL